MIYICRTIVDSVLDEFKELNREDLLNILKQHYKQTDISQGKLSLTIVDDARRNFVNRTELICQIVRKHHGLPENPEVKLYPEDQIDAEIDKRIRDRIKQRENLATWHKWKKSEYGIHREILKVALGFSKKLQTKNQIDSEITERCKLTGLSREEVEQRLYCAYFKIGIEEPEAIVIEA